MELKFDRIELPTFSGDLTEWNSFREIFTLLVHNNNQISNLLKFHQLRSHLKGVAYETIRGYQLSETNYNAAWTDLVQRYDRTNNIIHEYIKKFSQTPRQF